MSSEQEDLDNIVAQSFTSIEVLARALHVHDARLRPTLDAIVSTAARALSSAQDAGLILLDGGKLVPQATTSRVPKLLDLFQQKTGAGPCIDAARQQAVIRVTDTRYETRWPDFSTEARNCGVHSMLCVPLWVDERCLGTLSLYAALPSAFSDYDERITALFAALAALALAGAQRVDQMRTAISNRDLIGQAKGILMERYRLTADEAFGRLSAASQAENIKLAEVARQLAETGELPGGARAGR